MDGNAYVCNSTGSHGFDQLDEAGTNCVEGILGASNVCTIWCRSCCECHAPDTAFQETE